MRHRSVGIACALLVALSGWLPARGAAQTPAPAAWTAPETPWGDPDLQGIWSFATITPLERPSQFAGRDALTAEEVAAANAEAETRASSDRRSELTRETDVALAYNQVWWDRGQSTGRTALIVDPSDGRVPTRTAAAEARFEVDRVARGRDAWGPEDRNGAERCLQYRPLPRLPTGYNNHHLILQVPGYVVLLTEMIHNVRVIPIGERPHVDEAIRLKRRDPQFHELRATTAAKLGDDEAQAKSLKLYHKYSKGSERRDRTLDRMLVVNPRY